MKRQLWKAAVCGTIPVLGCTVQEPTVIVNRAPFYRHDLPFAARCEQTIISAVKSFASQNGMTVMLAQKSLEPGDFNVSANRASLNLKAMHIASIDNGLSIFAISAVSPTAAETALVKAFEAQVGSCS